MAQCRKQFDTIDEESCVTPLVSKEDLFVPDMSLPVKEILEQFSYVDALTLEQKMKEGYTMPDDDSAFDYPELNHLDPAERQELLESGRISIKRYRQILAGKIQDDAPDPEDEVISTPDPVENEK
jgi:hypothetical protein